MNEVKWRDVAIGWLAAFVAFIVIALIFGAIFGVADPDTATGATIGGIFASLISGFLSYGIGGYIAARRAGVNGPLNGAMVGVFGVVVQIALTIVILILVFIAGLLFSGGRISGFQGISGVEGIGLASGGVLAALAILIVNILGGYVGGRISGPEESDSTPTERPRRVR